MYIFLMANTLLSLLRQCWSGAHYHSASLIRASTNGDVACSVSWIRMMNTLNTCFINCLHGRQML